jgi:hypothetical protein
MFSNMESASRTRNDLSIGYGAAPRRFSRRALRWWIGGLLIALLFISVMAAAWRHFYYSDRNATNAALEAVDGIRIDRIDGFDDGPDWKLVGAGLILEASADKTIYLQGANARDLRSGKHLLIKKFGDFTFDVIDPNNGRPEWIDIGRDGAFADFLPIKVRDVSELVRRYDEVYSAIQGVPRTGTHKGPDGRVYQYRILVKGQ